MKKPFISIIIPTYNEEKYLGRCLDALRRQQTKYPFEIILVDHRSKDKTRAIAHQYRTHIINEKRRGTAVARQTGAEHAQTELLAFTEADCLPPPDWIETISSYFIRHPFIVGIVGRYYYDDIGGIKKKMILAGHTISNLIFHLIHGHYPFRGTNFAVRRDIVLKAGGFREDKAPFDDADCSNRVAKHGYIAYVPTCIVQTSSRRVKGRIFTYLVEFIYSTVRIFILGHRGDIRWYKVIR